VLGKREGKRPLGKPRIIWNDIKINLEIGWRTWTGLGPVASSCGRSNEPSGYINDREFLNQLSDYQLLKKDSSSWK
jgi:hypothetical protein